MAVKKLTRTSYTDLTALLIEAVKEQQAAIEQLRARLVTVEPATV